MDTGPEAAGADPVVVTGLGRVLDAACDATPFLKERKQRKFMGPQDALAVVAAGEALRSAGLAGAPLGERAGLYLAAGYIPFERADIDVLVDNSVDEKGLSMSRFASEGFYSLHPNLTFRCLTNMPAYHVSVNFDVQGPYFVTYPGIGQWYLALQEACDALAAGRVDVAILAAVAYQRNFLVEHHFGRIAHPIPGDRLRDAGACLVLERESGARARSAAVRARLIECDLTYAAHDPFEESPAAEDAGCGLDGEYGPACLAVALAGSRGTLRHSVRTRDGIRASSRWEVA